MSYYHLRVTVVKESAKQLVKQFYKRFQPDQLACFYELKQVQGKADNPHIHVHLRYPSASSIPKRSTLSNWMGAQGYAGKYYHKAVKTTAIKNLGYVSKGGEKIYIKNIDQADLDYAKDVWDELGELKDMKMIDRLKIAVEQEIKKYNRQFRFSTLKKLICEYHRTNGMLVPTTGLLLQYTVSISIDLGICVQDLELYYGI